MHGGRGHKVDTVTQPPWDGLLWVLIDFLEGERREREAESAAASCLPVTNQPLLLVYIYNRVFKLRDSSF